MSGLASEIIIVSIPHISPSRLHLHVSNKGRPAECLLLCSEGFASDPFELPPRPSALTQSRRSPTTLSSISSAVELTLPHTAVQDRLWQCAVLRFNGSLRFHDMSVYLIWAYTDPLSSLSSAMSSYLFILKSELPAAISNFLSSDSPGCV